MKKNIVAFTSLKSSVKIHTKNMKLLLIVKRINHLSSIFIDARQTNILNFSILDVPKLRCRIKSFETHLNVFSSIEGSLRQPSIISAISVHNNFEKIYP